MVAPKTPILFIYYELDQAIDNLKLLSLDQDFSVLTPLTCRSGHFFVLEKAYSPERHLATSLFSHNWVTTPTPPLH